MFSSCYRMYWKYFRRLRLNWFLNCGFEWPRFVICLNFGLNCFLIFHSFRFTNLLCGLLCLESPWFERALFNSMSWCYSMLNLSLLGRTEIIQSSTPTIFHPIQPVNVVPDLSWFGLARTDPPRHVAGLHIPVTERGTPNIYNGPQHLLVLYS